jgi:hypothetical protein
LKVEATYDGRTFHGVGPSKSIAKVSKKFLKTYLTVQYLLQMKFDAIDDGRIGVGPSKSIAKVSKSFLKHAVPVLFLKVEATYDVRTF